MCLQNVTAVHLLDMETFDWANANLDLLVMLEEKSGVYLSKCNSSSGDHGN